MSAKRSTFAIITVLVSLLFTACAPGVAPTGIVPNIADVGNLPGLPTINDLFSVNPITTSFADSYPEEAQELAGLELSDLGTLPRTAEGLFLLAPGLYALEAESFCLQAGTHGPSDGDGYLPAPLMGDREAIAKKILSTYANHPTVTQRDAQVLLWAILARTRYTNMPAGVQATAATLLTPEELLELNGGAISLIPDVVWRELERQIPAELRQIYAAEQRLRNLLESANASYQALEQAAVLSGAAPAATLARSVPRGQWAQHPDGYFIRYFPQGYSRTRIEVFVPERQALTELVFDPSATVATPANTSAQRLGIGTPRF